MIRWQPISTAPQLEGKEILGCKFQWDGRCMVMVREPFVSCWSQSTARYTSSPSHWIDCPDVPEPSEKDRMRHKPKSATA